MTEQPETDAEAIAALDACYGFKVPWSMTMQRQMRKALDAASAWRKTQADAMPWPDTYPMPAHGWTCFHCGETFTTPGSARDHFGCEPCADPACRIKVGEERGLVMALRKAEKALEPFATFGICDDGEDIRDGLMRDRIVDWFGPGDFNAARAALAPLPEKEQAQ